MSFYFIFSYERKHIIIFETSGDIDTSPPRTSLAPKTMHLRFHYMSKGLEVDKKIVGQILKEREKISEKLAITCM